MKQHWEPTYNERVQINKLTATGATILTIFRQTKIEKHRLKYYLSRKGYAPVAEWAGGRQGWVTRWFKPLERCECGKAAAVALPMATGSDYTREGTYTADMYFCMGCFLLFREDGHVEQPRAIVYQ